MKKIALFITLTVFLFASVSVSAANKDTDLKSVLTMTQKFAEKQNRFLSDNLENMMHLLGRENPYNQVKKIREAISSLLEGCRKMTAAAGEILKKERLEKKDIILFINKMELSIVALRS